MVRSACYAHVLFVTHCCRLGPAAWGSVITMFVGDTVPFFLFSVSYTPSARLWNCFASGEGQHTLNQARPRRNGKNKYLVFFLLPSMQIRAFSGGVRC